MSRIGKKSISIPKGVQVKLENDQLLFKGPKGEKSLSMADSLVTIELGEGKIRVLPQKKLKLSNPNPAHWGLYRALISNLIKGVNVGFERVLIYQGVGFRAVVNGNDLDLNLGFSHPLKVSAPEGISFKVEKNKIIISGIDKEIVGQVAAKIKSLRKPEPYKGRGIRYDDEIIIRKAGKKAATGA